MKSDATAQCPAPGELVLPPRFETVGSAQQYLRAQGASYVLAQFVDIHGVAKAKSVPVSHLPTVLDAGVGFAGFAIGGSALSRMARTSWPMAVGDLITLSLLAWQPGLARLVCDGHVAGQPWEYDSRVTLKQQVARLAEHGYNLVPGLEPEFFLLQRDVHGVLGPADPGDNLAKPCYDYKGLPRTRAFLERLSNALRATGIDVYQIDHEDANGQFELNFTYADCLTSADHFVLLKMAASEIANEFGYICSFIPKPFANRPGNGMHMHLSLGDGQRNLFENKNDARGLDRG